MHLTLQKISTGKYIFFPGVCHDDAVFLCLFLCCCKSTFIKYKRKTQPEKLNKKY